MLNIRRAETKDIGKMLDLLSQVLEVHAEIRPDLFISGTRKYTEAELREILQNENRPIFVAEDEKGQIVGDCFCILEKVTDSNNLRDSLTLYMDDLCVDEKHRRHHVGKALCDYAVDYGRKIGCYDITLNVWEGNDKAMDFYRSLGFQPRKTVMEKIL